MSTSNNPSPDHHGNAVVMPGWGDEFDLTDFFRRLDPQRFEFQDTAERAAAKEVFKMVQGLILRWVALYRALVRAANLHPETVTKSVLCIRTMGKTDWTAYSSWFSSPNKDFDEISPEQWFKRNGLEDLCLLIGGEQSGFIRKVRPENSPNCGPITPCRGNSSTFGRGQDDQSTIGVAHQLRRITNSDQDPLWSLRSIFDSWRSHYQKFASASDRLLVSELLMVLEAESFGWLSLYHCVLDTARERSGILAYVALCFKRLQSFGVCSYLKWFRSPQADFGGISPESFFVGQGYVNLAVLLDSA